MFERLRKRLEEWHKSREPRVYRVRVLEDGFQVEQVGQDEAVERVHVKWSEVQEVRAYKRDLFAYDMVCLGLITSDEQWVEVWEDDAGYKEFMPAMESNLPGIVREQEWWSKVAFPAFVTNETVIYQRSKDAAAT